MTSDKNQDGLDAFFEAARAAPGPGDDLVARVLADAASVQAEPAVVAPAAAPSGGFLQAIGGWIAVSGLAAACATGLALGLALPSAVSAGLDGGFSTLLEGQQAMGYTGFDAVSFADGDLDE